MLSHARIWSAIDRLAAAHELTASALARRAGLDPTTFNRSKRFAADGRPRWPSTESIAKILAATQSNLEQFIAAEGPHAADRPSSAREIPVLGLAKAGAGGYFDDGGFPVGHAWDRIAFPASADNVFALEVNGDSMLPLYRDGDTIIVIRDVPCRQGDRVVIKTRDGEIMAKVLQRSTGRSFDLVSVNPDHPPRTVLSGDVEWIARIVWASQ